MGAGGICSDSFDYINGLVLILLPPALQISKVFLSGKVLRDLAQMILVVVGVVEMKQQEEQEYQHGRPHGDQHLRQERQFF